METVNFAIQSLVLQNMQLNSAHSFSDIKLLSFFFEFFRCYFHETYKKLYVGDTYFMKQKSSMLVRHFQQHLCLVMIKSI